MPPGVRGLLIAGVFATAMGSLSTALNALATSFTQDLVYALYPARGDACAASSPRPRWSTVVFASSWSDRRPSRPTPPSCLHNRADHPHRARDLRLHLRLAAGGLPARDAHQDSRQRNAATSSPWRAALSASRIWSGLPWDLFNAVRGQSYDISHLVITLSQHGLLIFKDGYVQPPDWLVQIEFPWRVMFGTLTTYAVAWCFKRDESVPGH